MQEEMDEGCCQLRREWEGNRVSHVCCVGLGSEGLRIMLLIFWEGDVWYDGLQDRLEVGF